MPVCASRLPSVRRRRKRSKDLPIVGKPSRPSLCRAPAARVLAALAMAFIAAVGRCISAKELL